MLLGISGLAISFFLMSAADSLWMLFAARIIGGLLSSANMPTTMAYVADITTAENCSKGMGMIGAAVGLGFVFGPAIGGIFSETSLALPFVIAGSSSLLTIILVALLLKESSTKEGRSANSIKAAPFYTALKGDSGILFFLQFFISLSLSGLEATFAYFAAEKAGLDSIILGYIFMIMGLAGAVVQGGLIGPLTKKYGEGKVIQGGIIVSAIGFALILLTRDFLTASIFLTTFGIGNGVIRPSVSSVLTKTMDTGHGSITGLLSSFDSLGRIIGPPLGGVLYSVSAGCHILRVLFYRLPHYSCTVSIMQSCAKKLCNNSLLAAGADPAAFLYINLFYLLVVNPHIKAYSVQVLAGGGWKMALKTRATLLGLAGVLAAAGYLESPFSVINRDYYYQTEGPAQMPALSRPGDGGSMELEQKLVSTRKSGGYIIETYREYEITRDSFGRVTESTPTSHYEEIKYKEKYKNQ
jgi:DHA1 family multidrug resistance protein-like MFS transporter